MHHLDFWSALGLSMSRSEHLSRHEPAWSFPPGMLFDLAWFWRLINFPSHVDAINLCFRPMNTTCI